MRFSRQEYWSGLPFPLPEDLPDTGTERTSFMSPALAGGFLTSSATWEAQYNVQMVTFVYTLLVAVKLLSCV